MSTLVTYSSLTENTKRLAVAIFDAIPGEKEILPVSQVQSVDSYDTILVGSYITGWRFSKEAEKLLQSLKGKKVGLFATLTYWPDSDLARESINSAAKLVEEENLVIAKYIAQGSLGAKIKSAYSKNLPEDHVMHLSKEKERRFFIADSHPSKLELELGAQLFAERLQADLSKETAI